MRLQTVCSGMVLSALLLDCVVFDRGPGKASVCSKVLAEHLSPTVGDDETACAVCVCLPGELSTAIPQMSWLEALGFV